MRMGEVIRNYRKEKGLTQTEMAERLGVTAPAVNKWEKGSSYPDIQLLAPIARLLGISTDTLLAFHENLTAEEVEGIVRELDQRLKQEGYEAAFGWAKKRIEEYPDCENLIWQLAVMLDAGAITYRFSDAERQKAYEEKVYSWYRRVLAGRDEELRQQAARSLLNFSVRKGEYGQAEEYLQYFSRDNPERKLLQAEIYYKKGKIREAYQTYEELLFAEYSVLSMALDGLYNLAMQEQDLGQAHFFADKRSELARLFEMGKFHEVSACLELAIVEKDVETTIETAKQMFQNVDSINGFLTSKLYGHMTFREADESFWMEYKEQLLQCFQEDETLGFLQEDERWQNLIKSFQG